MKKIILILSVGFIFAQDTTDLPPTHNIVGGLLMAGATVEDDVEGTVEMLPSANFGYQYTGLLSNNIPLVLGTGITMRGFNLTNDSDNNIEFRMTYLDFYAFFPYPVGPGAVIGGIGLGMALNGTATIGSTEIDLLEEGSSMDDSAWLNSVDYGLLFGYNMPLNETLSIGGAYYLGLNEMWSDGDYGKHNGLVLNLGYALPF